MLDVIACLEAAGSGTSFADDALVAAGRTPVGLLDELVGLNRTYPGAMACLIMTPDGGDTEPQQDQPDQDDDGRQDQDEQEARTL